MPEENQSEGSSFPKTRAFGYIVQYRLNDSTSDGSTQENDDNQFITLPENLSAMQTQARAINLSDEKGAGFFFRVATVLITQEPENIQKGQASSTEAAESAGLGNNFSPRSAWTTHSQAFHLKKPQTSSTAAVNDILSTASTPALLPPKEMLGTTGLLSAGKTALALHLTYDEHYPTLGKSSAMMTAAGRPEFREVYMSRFTTPTTCYSGPRYVSQGIGTSHPVICPPSSSWKAYLATEQNLLEMTINKDAATGILDNRQGVSFVQYPLPTPPGLPRRLAKHFTCVGYSHCRNNSGWEAMVLLDTAHQSQQQQQQQDAMNTGDIGTMGGDHSYAGNTMNNNDDDRTVATMATVDSQSSASHHHHNRSSSGGGGGGFRRANSGGNASVSSADGAGVSVTSSSMASVASSSPAVILTGGEGSGGGLTSRNSTGGIRATLANLDEEERVEGSLEQNQQPVARLVLIHREKELHYAKSLDFRPLAPCIGSLVCKGEHGSNNDSTKEATVGVWIGSADDTKLRFFRAHDTTGSLVEVPVNAELNEDNESPMTFESPIMAIDCLTLPAIKISGTESDPSSITNDGASAEEQEENQIKYNNLLAVACQDGIVRLIGYSSTLQLEIQCREEYTVTIDGPIVNIILTYKKETEKVEAVIGSLCGYVARFLKDANLNGKSVKACWNGPYMVAEGFRTGAQEDSVLVVHSWGDTIAVGTYSGRCLLYAQISSDDAQEYGQPFLDFQLPESIHGICHIPSDDCNTLLLVTTRKSVHLFQEIPKVYNPDMAKRILKSLVEMRQRSKPMLSPSEESKEAGEIEKTFDQASSVFTT